MRKYRLEITPRPGDYVTGIVVRFNANDEEHAHTIAGVFRSLHMAAFADYPFMITREDVPAPTDLVYEPPVDRDLLTKLGALYGYPAGIAFHYDKGGRGFCAEGLNDFPRIPLDIYLSFYERKHGGVL